METKDIKKSTNCILPSPQVPGGKDHNLKVGLAQILMHTEQRRRSPAWGDGGLCPLGCTAAPDLLPQPCRLAAALSLVGRGDTQGKDAQRVESRIDLRLALEPSQKTLSGKIVEKKKKVMIFTALGGAQSLGFTA